MPDLADLPGLASRLSAALTAAKVPHAVSGAIAMAAHGFVRATMDIDVLVVVPSLRLPEVFAIVRTFGFAGEDRALIEGLRARAVAELRSGSASVEIIVPVLPYHHEVLRRSVVLGSEGKRVPFVTAEDLVVLKVLWLRAKDRADVRALLAARSGTMDLAYIRRTLGELLPAGDHRHAAFEEMAAPS